jgi:hypothetical protein
MISVISLVVTLSDADNQSDYLMCLGKAFHDLDCLRHRKYELIPQG